MVHKARLGLYLEDEDIKKRIKIAAAKRGVSTTIYCAQAIEERLKREGELSDKETENKRTFLLRVDKLRKELGPINISTAELVKEGRRR
jgi:hypothetical protein